MLTLRIKGDDFNPEINEKRVSPLDLVERFPEIDIPFVAFLTMLPQLRLRQYSISSSPFDIAETPLIMVCAGTGIAPFRGFVQERALQIEAGQKLAPALLFFGCHKPGQDDLHADELSAWASKGVEDVRYAYSRDPESSNGAKYVQDRFRADREDVLEYFRSGAKVLMCGSGKVAGGVRDASVKIYMQAKEEDGIPKTKEEAEEWFNTLRNTRFMSDVFD